MEIIVPDQHQTRIVTAPKNKAIAEVLARHDVALHEEELPFEIRFNDLNEVRYYADQAFRHFGASNDKAAKKEREKIRKELKHLRDAIYSISDETFAELIHTEGVGDFSKACNLILKQIDAAVQKNLLGPGGNSMVKFHKAASYLLQHFDVINGKPTASEFEKAGGSGRQYSAAVEFLNDEFQRLARDNIDRRQSSVTIIKAWLKSNPKTRSNTTK
jgi:hypothetical protein